MLFCTRGVANKMSAGVGAGTNMEGHRKTKQELRNKKVLSVCRRDA